MTQYFSKILYIVIVILRNVKYINVCLSLNICYIQIYFYNLFHRTTSCRKMYLSIHRTIFNTEKTDIRFCAVLKHRPADTYIRA